jgi:hypothetical protein
MKSQATKPQATRKGLKLSRTDLKKLVLQSGLKAGWKKAALGYSGS